MSSQPSQHSVGTRVLVVDHDPMMREVCREALESGGYGVELASSGAEARALFENRPASLVLCDIFMPSQDDCDTIPVLTRASRGPRVIAISGGAGDMLKVARLLGADAVLVKPFEDDDLMSVVSSLDD
jgi:CheY-like chemotaxis protein